MTSVFEVSPTVEGDAIVDGGEEGAIEDMEFGTAVVVEIADLEESPSSPGVPPASPLPVVEGVLTDWGSDGVTEVAPDPFEEVACVPEEAACVPEEIAVLAIVALAELDGTASSARLVETILLGADDALRATFMISIDNYICT